MPDFGHGESMTTEQLDHYFDVRRERRRQGLPVFTEKEVYDRHPMLGKRLRNTQTGKIYVVERVTSVWLDGFYEQMTIREEGTKSHGLIFWTNQSSKHEGVIEGVKEANEKYDLIKD